MDKFEQAMRQMASMSEEERIKMIEAKKELCICGNCPTYNNCAREKRGITILRHERKPFMYHRRKQLHLSGLSAHRANEVNASVLLYKRL